MQIVIDIPEEDYNNIEPFLNGQTIKGGFNLFKVLEIIKNGTPLEEEKECATCKYRETQFDEEPCSWCGNDCRNYERG